MQTSKSIAILLTALSFNFQSAFAAEPTVSKTTSPTFLYLEKIGLREILLEKRERSRESTVELLNKIIDQMRAQEPDFPDEIAAKMRASMEGLADSMINAYSIDDALMVYAEPFDKGYSPKELKKQIKELSTPENIREIKILNEASMKMSEFILRKENEATEKAMSNILGQMKDAIEVWEKERKGKRKQEVSPVSQDSSAK
jgi:hypothetical protein